LGKLKNKGHRDEIKLEEMRYSFRRNREILYWEAEAERGSDRRATLELIMADLQKAKLTMMGKITVLSNKRKKGKRTRGSKILALPAMFGRPRPR
jgi:hypothetical protein